MALLKWLKRARYAYGAKQSIPLEPLLAKRDALTRAYAGGAARGTMAVARDFVRESPAILLARRHRGLRFALLGEAYRQARRQRADDGRFTDIVYPERRRTNRFRPEDLVVLYRFYEKNGVKPRPEGFDKFSCFAQFSRVFAAARVYVFMDNSSAEARQRLQAIRPDATIFENKVGNSGNLLKALDFALTLPGNPIVYLLEDDYAHRPGADRVMLEAFNSAIPFDYLSLYDHPDKYVDGYNPHVIDGGEVSKVFFTGTIHWKETNSTTMTLAATKETLRADLGAFQRFCKGGTPNDFGLFNYFRRKRGRRLITCIPGYSSHGEAGAETPLLPEGLWRHP